MDLPLTVLRPAAADLPLDRQEVLRYLGYKPGVTRLGARDEALVDEGIRLALAAAAPVVSLATCAVTVSAGAVETRVPGLAWRSKVLAGAMRDAEAITLFAGTVGFGVEAEVARLFAADEFALATVVDAAGTALAQAAGRWALDPDARLYGPGYGDWPIHDLIPLVAAAGGPAIGLNVTETCYLTPQKSLVGVAVTGGSACGRCLQKDCAHRERNERR